MSDITLPPMEYNLWGTPEESKPLPAAVKKITKSLFGAKGNGGASLPAEKIRLPQSGITPVQLRELGKIVGDNYVSQEHEQRLRRSRGKSYPDLLKWRIGETLSAPDAVIAPKTEAEVLRILKYCSEEKIAVVTFGGGTSVTGGISPLAGGMKSVLSLDVNRFCAVEDVDRQSMLATLGAGLTGPHAELLLAQYGLQLGHFPQSFPYATIGGYAVTRSSGQSSAGYGRFSEMVRSLTVVTPQGIMEVGRQAPSSAAGPDLRELIMGSEGIFGVVTRVRVRVHPIPQTKHYEAFSFPDFKTGCRALRAVEQEKTGPTVIRLSDEIESAVNLASTDSIGETDAKESGCVCITMYEGSAPHTASRHLETRNLLLKMGAVSLGEGPARQWEKGRFKAPVLRDALLDGAMICETLETATDWENIVHLRAAAAEALGTHLPTTPALIMCHVSHVYPEGASLYFTVIAGQSKDPVGQWEKAKAAVCRAIEANGGTVSHHHGVGTDHLPYMEEEIGPLGIKILRAVKDALDPVGIMNPGKLIPTEKKEKHDEAGG